ncbi:mitochondrial outer membrane translocase complex, subunit Tom22 [Lasiosphaeria miniovina]|uniref:Mitochondrial outer membrane translocase complex, subunit Tom22 n=2 Tax=Lasiosphaeria TaxID=92901 RepID=A0AA40AV40_9PEZI|nr:mitochondrial outer membrane translocase complex, subunit Tom22 [Lasiosphaeria miniovina]KAK0722590.1 mitochondrial outer membrane translocase complex, subunit Tom22 [Lasiosphaeria miniovina]KAK3379711.1 mitochondrial import receptor subunit tom22 [Lasiosphaeria ovina]
MVQLTEVEDEHFQQQSQQIDDDDFTDTDSEISTDSNYDPFEESLAERLYALRDIVPPTARGWMWNKVQGTTRFVKTTLFFCGRAAWALSVSALLVGVPFALALSEDQNLMAMEQEQRMREMGAEMLTSGAEDKDTAERVGAALGREGGSGAARPAL